MASCADDCEFVCAGCDNTLTSFIVLSEDLDKLQLFLYDHGVLPRSKKCSSCGNSMTLNTETHSFNCYKYIETVNRNRKKVKKQCKKYISQYKNTWFEYHKLNKQFVDLLLFGL